MAGLEFYLSQLDISLTSESATLSGAQSEAFTGDATVAVDIPLANARNIFQFHTDSDDVNNDTVDDIKYRVVYDSNNDTLNMVFNIDTSAEVISGYVKYEEPNSPTGNLTYDFNRHLADRLFNTHRAVDLILNELELRHTLRDNFSTAFHNSMTSLNEIETDHNGNSAPKTILNHIIHSNPERLQSVYDLRVDEDQQWFKCPFHANDILYFRLTVNPASGQHNLTGRQEGDVPSKVYLIKATLRA
jgi:hypothetical protein